MDDDRRAFKEAWDYRVAVRRFESAFEAAERLPVAERQLLLEQVARWLLQHIQNFRSEEQKTVKVVGIEINQADTQSISPSDDEPPEAA
jgi:hypothetical protein